MAIYFLEAKAQPGDADYSDRAQTINLGTRSWTLKPRPEYGGRRIIEIDDERTFTILKQNNSWLKAATDLIEDNEWVNLNVAVAVALKPIEARLAALEANGKRKKEPD